MSKRAASYDIDQHTYEEKVKSEGHEAIEPQGSHMNGRKIYKIARNTKGPQSQPKEKIDIKIQGFGDSKDKQGKDDKSKDAKVPSPLFQFDFFKQSQGVGLFSNIFSNSPAPKQPDNPASKNGPNSEVPPKPLFESKKPQSTPSLFSNSLGSGGSIFPNTNGILFSGSTNSFQGSSLFGNSKISGPITAPPQQDSGDSGQLQKDQQMEVDPNKTTVKYDYGKEITIVQKILTNKYKKDKGELIQGVEVVISYNTDTKLHYLVARLAVTKNIIFTGLLVPNKSKANVNGDNVDVLAFSIAKGGSLQPNRIKMQIKTENNAKDQFISNINNIITHKQESS